MNGLIDDFVDQIRLPTTSEPVRNDDIWRFPDKVHKKRGLRLIFCLRYVSFYVCIPKHEGETRRVPVGGGWVESSSRLVVYVVWLNTTTGSQVIVTPPDILSEDV